MNLRFPELGGGAVQGLNDAGVENFEGAIDVFLARECGQNTVDATASTSEVAKLEFSKLLLPAEVIPALSELRQALNSCLSFWGEKAKERKFFEHAVEVASRTHVPVLKISDFGTTGLTGGDADYAGRWFALVKSQGVSNKDEVAGGSFGIGKSSPFAASSFRSVFYGTRLPSGEEALQGVVRLATHRNGDNKLTQGVGFIGDYVQARGNGDDPLFAAVRDRSRIPAGFRREQPGTDIWVIGYRSGDDWGEQLIKSILKDFWPAVHNGRIEFRVADQDINQAELSDLMARYAGSAEFDADKYYQAVQSTPVRRSLKSVGDCTLHLTTYGEDLPKRICMTRQSGMRIFDYQPRACRVPFSGLFSCTDRRGNELLRQLEPPRHDSWDPRRVEDESGKKALSEIKAWIREEVKKLNPLVGANSFNEAELAKYLPDSTSPDEFDSPEGSYDDGNEESLGGRPKPGNPLPSRTKAGSVTVPDDGSGVGGVGEDEDGGHPPPGGGNRRKHKQPAGGVPTGAKPTKLSSRAYAISPSRYTLILRSSIPYVGPLRIRAIGEDGGFESLDLAGVWNAGGVGESLAVDGDLVSGIRVGPDAPLRLSVELRAAVRRSLVAEAANDRS